MLYETIFMVVGLRQDGSGHDGSYSNIRVGYLIGFSCRNSNMQRRLKATVKFLNIGNH